MEPITFRRLARTDFPLVEVWLARPYVSRWWNHDPSPEAVERDFGGTIDGSDPTEVYIASLEGRPFGLIEWSRFSDYPEYREELEPLIEVPAGAATIDYLIGEPDLVGMGLGKRMISAFVQQQWRSDSTAGPVIVAVASANEASWRALLGAGFHTVAQGDLEPDNPIDDPLHEVLRLDRPER